MQYYLQRYSRAIGWIVTGSKDMHFACASRHCLHKQLHAFAPCQAPASCWTVAAQVVLRVSSPHVLQSATGAHDRLRSLNLRDVCPKLQHFLQHSGGHAGFEQN